MRTDRTHNIADLRRAAHRTLPGVLFDYVDGAADDEATMRANETAFDDWVFRPRMPATVGSPEISVTVLGTRLRLPVLLAPCGLIRLMHPAGAAGVARAAAGRGTVSMLSTFAGTSIEEVAPQAPGTVWFQLYASGRSTAESLIERVRTAGVEVLVVTTDTAAYGNRERDVRHGVGAPLRIDARGAVRLASQVARRPRWACRMVGVGIEMTREVSDWRAQDLASEIVGPSPFTWADIGWIRSRWPGRLVVKGILTGDEARKAVDHGANGIVVSNHGGRQLDAAPATCRVLPEVVEAAGSSAEVLLDGGVRRGSHVLRALALGARAVLVGRPYVWGLAAGGQAGVEHVLDLFEQEIVRTMALLGCPSVNELGPEWVDCARPNSR